MYVSYQRLPHMYCVVQLLNVSIMSCNYYVCASVCVHVFVCACSLQKLDMLMDY